MLLEDQLHFASLWRSTRSPGNISWKRGWRTFFAYDWRQLTQDSKYKWIRASLHIEFWWLPVTRLGALPKGQDRRCPWCLDRHPVWKDENKRCLRTWFKTVFLRFSRKRTLNHTSQRKPPGDYWMGQRKQQQVQKTKGNASPAGGWGWGHWKAPLCSVAAVRDKKERFGQQMLLLFNVHYTPGCCVSRLANPKGILLLDPSCQTFTFTGRVPNSHT